MQISGFYPFDELEIKINSETYVISGEVDYTAYLYTPEPDVGIFSSYCEEVYLLGGEIIFINSCGEQELEFSTLSKEYKISWHMFIIEALEFALQDELVRYAQENYEENYDD